MLFDYLKHLFALVLGEETRNANHRNSAREYVDQGAQGEGLVLKGTPVGLDIVLLRQPKDVLIGMLRCSYRRQVEEGFLHCEGESSVFVKSAKCLLMN